MGWNNASFSGLKPQCLDYIKEVWTDLRPLSLRKNMEGMPRQEN
jgi:MbtH protein